MYLYVWENDKVNEQEFRNYSRAQKSSTGNNNNKNVKNAMERERVSERER